MKSKDASLSSRSPYLVIRRSNASPSKIRRGSFASNVKSSLAAFLILAYTNSRISLSPTFPVRSNSETLHSHHIEQPREREKQRERITKTSCALHISLLHLRPYSPHLFNSWSSRSLSYGLRGLLKVFEQFLLALVFAILLLLFGLFYWFAGITVEC